MRPKFVWQPELRDVPSVTEDGEEVPDSLDSALLAASEPRIPIEKPIPPPEPAPPSEPIVPLVLPSVSDFSESRHSTEEIDLGELLEPRTKPTTDEVDLDEIIEAATPPAADNGTDTLSPKTSLSERPAAKRREGRAPYLLTVMVAVGVLLGSILAITPSREPKLLMARALNERASAVLAALELSRQANPPPAASNDAPAHEVEELIDLDESNARRDEREPVTKENKTRTRPRVIIERAPYRSVPVRPGEQVGVLPL